MSVSDQYKNDTAGLITAVQSGDKDSFASIYRLFFASLCDFTYYLTKDEEVAKELVQDTFLSIWEQRKDWSPQGTIRSYLFRAAKNRSLDYLKHQKIVRKWEKTTQEQAIPYSQNEDDHLSQAELITAIDNQIDRLPQKCKIIFIMSRQQGLTYREIAEIQGVSIKTVETQVGRALKKLRESLHNYL